MNTSALALRLFGQTPESAWAKDICVRCSVPVEEEDMTPVDWAEYLITAICPKCWAELVGGEE